MRNFFTKLDANQGYWQIPLDHESSLLTTTNTPFGRIRFMRLPYGIHTAQEIFHKRVANILASIDNVETDIDDVLIHGENVDSHHIDLIRSLDKLKENNVTLNINKCVFGVSEVTYLGHRINAQGVHPDEAKIKAIKEMPTPTNEKDIQ